MTHVLLVGIGGFLGSVLRYLVSIFFASNIFYIPIPVIFVNLIGSLLIGVFLGLPINKLQPLWHSFLISGLIGGFTTFSAFSGESMTLLTKAEYLPAMLYISINLLGGLLLCFLGLWLTKSLI